MTDDDDDEGECGPIECAWFRVRLVRDEGSAGSLPRRDPASLLREALQDIAGCEDLEYARGVAQAALARGQS